MPAQLVPLKIRAFPIAAVSSVQAAAAAEAFWTLKKDFLLRLAGYLNIDLPDTSGLVPIVEHMIGSILSVSSEQAVDLMTIRLGHMQAKTASGIDDLLDMPDATWCITHQEMEDLQAEFSASSSRAQAANDFGKAWTARRAQVKTSTGKSKKPKVKSAPPSERRLPPGDLFQPDLKPLLPPGGSLWRGHQRGTWNGHYPPFARITKSWLLYGHRTAAVLVLRQLWEQHLLVSGQEISECPILGLFDDNAAEAALPDASSSSGAARSSAVGARNS